SAGAPFGNVEIDLDDPLLRPGEVDRISDRQLDSLADEAAARPEEQVAGHLHGDGAGAAQPAALVVVGQRLAHGAPIYAGMTAEAVVLGREHGTRKIRGHLVERPPGALHPVTLDE